MIVVPKKIEIKMSPGKGRGVFATNFIQKDEVIEHCPLLFLPTRIDEDDLLLFDYRFDYPCNQFIGQLERKFVLPMGYGCLYNHSDNNNANWRQIDINTFEFYAIKDIFPGEEICTCYNAEADNYFKQRNIERI